MNSDLISKQMQRLLRQNPSAINKLFIEAVNHYQNEEFDKAEAGYRQILAKDPQHADSLHLLGLILADRGQYEEAIALITQAISRYPQFALYYSNRAALYQRLNRHMEAVTDFHQSIQLDPKRVAVWIKFGDSLLALEKIPGALDAYQKALELEPNSSYTYQMIGNAYFAKEAYEDAALAFQQVLRLKPATTEALVNLGMILGILKKYDEAISYYEQALAIQPDNAIIHFNLATVLDGLGRYKAAEQCYFRAIAINPNFIEAYINLWLLYYKQGKVKKAASYLSKARSIHPHYPEIAWNEALILLQQGNFKEGWKGYELRLQLLKEHQKRAPISKPRWQGQSFIGKALLIRTEQGLGDSLQFIRYLPLVKELGGRVIVECQRELSALFKATYSGVVDTWIPQGGTPPIFDYYIDLLSLPFIFQTTLETIPFPQKYLQPSLNSVVTEKVKKLSKNIKVGLVWAGNPKYKNDASRSMSLTQYKPLLDLPGFTFCSLQWGKKGIEDIAQAKFDDRLINLAAELNDFVDTATAVTELDLVITTDTSMVHLVGALGQKAWVLLSSAPDFRWLLEREDSPWYHSLKLFRQPKVGDWKGVIERVISELTHLSQGKKTKTRQRVRSKT